MKSDYVSPERGARDPMLAMMLVQGQGREVDGDSLWLRNVQWSSQEIYEYDDNAKQKVVVARNVQGKDPRTLGDFGSPPALGIPQRLPSGVVEWPSATGQQDGHSLFTFPDNTWVIVESWMAPRFHAVFSSTAQSPPLPVNPPDTYVEYCFPRLRPNQIDQQKVDNINVEGVQHFAMRFHAGQMTTVEVALTYTTPEQAQRAELAERQACAAQHPCKLTGSRVEGRVARFFMGSAPRR